MLMPRKVKHRKQQRGRMRGQAKGGTEVTFGDYGIQALEPGCRHNNPKGSNSAEQQSDGLRHIHQILPEVEGESRRHAEQRKGPFVGFVLSRLTDAHKKVNRQDDGGRPNSRGCCWGYPPCHGS